MKRLNGREMKTLFILSIVIPVGVLTTFKLTGLLGKTRTVNETTTLDTIKWEFQRPDHYAFIENRLNATYDGSELIADMSVLVVDYIDRSQFLADHDQILLIFAINSTSAAPNCFVENINVVIYKDQQSLVEWSELDLQSENLSMVRLGQGYKWSTEAYIGLTNVNHSAAVYFSTGINWVLLTPDTQTHQLEVFFELIYYNGTAYEKVIQPFQLRILGR